MKSIAEQLISEKDSNAARVLIERLKSLEGKARAEAVLSAGKYCSADVFAWGLLAPLLKGGLDDVVFGEHLINACQHPGLPAANKRALILALKSRLPIASATPFRSTLTAIAKSEAEAPEIRSAAVHCLGTEDIDSEIVQALADSNCWSALDVVGWKLSRQTENKGVGRDLLSVAARNPSQVMKMPGVFRLAVKHDDAALVRRSLAGAEGVSVDHLVSAAGSSVPDSIKHLFPAKAAPGVKVYRKSPSQALDSPAPYKYKGFLERFAHLIKKRRCGNGKSTVVRGGFTSELRLAAAMYRDLDVGPQWMNHWHTGVFGGVRPQRDALTASYYEILNEDWAGTSRTRTRGLGGVDSDISAVSRDLCQDVIDQFRVGLEWHGVRSTNLDHRGMVNVAETASDLVGRRFEYTFTDMLNVYDEDTWNGHPEDIEEMRCDGLVAYAYEKNGIKVCKGENASHWNVCSGEDGVEGHNNLHADPWNPEEGELCPKSQAGGYDSHSDTTFKRLSISAPTIAQFSVEERAALGARYPFLTVEVNSAPYDSAFVRLSVRKGTGPFYYVYTEESGRQSVEGEWRFLEMSGAVEGMWNGKALDANGAIVDFRGQDGCYEFRVVAIDHGGSVSETLSLMTHVAFRVR